MNKEEIIRALKDQKEIYGDDLYEEFRYTAAAAVKKQPEAGAPVIHPVEKIEPEKTGGDMFVEMEDWTDSATLEELNKKICNCLKCPLGKTRKNFVFGSGSPNAGVMVVGEGPGADEDEQGLPFVGRAGKLLTDILKAINFERDEVYIANVVKCRPPGNRTPLPPEMETCLPYLHKQIDIIKPKALLCLGLTAAQGLLKKKDSLTNFRGKVFDVKGVKVMVTYHPAALLRNPNWKRGCWEDVQAFRKLYDGL